MKIHLITVALATALTAAACSGAQTDSAVKPADAAKPEMSMTTKTDTMADSMKEHAMNAAHMGENMDIKTKAVMIHADWCGSCKALDPKVKAAKSMGAMPGLEFVTLDYTAKDADDFYAQADAAGVGEAVRTYLDGTIKTGMLLLVDLDDKKVIGKVTKTSEPAQIVTALKDAIAAS